MRVEKNRRKRLIFTLEFRKSFVGVIAYDLALRKALQTRKNLSDHT